MGAVGTGQRGYQTHGSSVSGTQPTHPGLNRQEWSSGQSRVSSPVRGRTTLVRFYRWINEAQKYTVWLRLVQLKVPSFVPSFVSSDRLFSEAEVFPSRPARVRTIHSSWIVNRRAPRSQAPPGEAASNPRYSRLSGPLAVAGGCWTRSFGRIRHSIPEFHRSGAYAFR